MYIYIKYLCVCITHQVIDNQILNFWSQVIAPDLPLGLVTRAAPWCQRLAELQFQAGQDTLRCVELLREAPVKQLGVKGRYVESQDCQDPWAKMWMFASFSCLSS